MSMINYAAGEISCKVVYFGPGLGGKTTNVEWIHSRVAPESRGRLVSLSTSRERTLFFDFLPLDLGGVAGFRTRLHLYSVPGQLYHRSTRRMVLRGVDGVVFVADSHPHRMEANEESMEDLKESLNRMGRDLLTIPAVLQYNKRDLSSAIPIGELRARLNPEGLPEHEAAAVRGEGVFETLRTVTRLVLATLRKAG